MAFREILIDDLPAMFEVRIATWHNSNGRDELTKLGITPQSVQQMMQDSHRGWLCEVDGQQVGFAMGNRRTGEMWVIAVLKEFEGRGIGKQLLQLVEEWLRQEGWNEIWLTTDKDESLRAVGFYRRQGWTDWKIEDGDRYMRKVIGERAVNEGPMTRIIFEELPWIEPADGVRYKVVAQNGRKIRFVEFDVGFSETDWCRLGHIGYVVAGHIEIAYVDRLEELRQGNALVIRGGDTDKHRVKVIEGPVRIFLVEDA